MDILTIEVRKKDGELYAGGLRLEHIDQYVLQSLGFDPASVHTVKPGFGMYLFFMVKLKHLIDTRNLPKEAFNIEITAPQRDGRLEPSDFQFFLKGLKALYERDRRRSGKDDGVRWGTIDEDFTGMESEENLQNWLVHFGQIQSEMQPETKKNGNHEIRTGRLKVKLKLETNIPQYVPIYGKIVWFYYHDIKKLCTNCNKTLHYKSDCSNKKHQLLTLVADFMEKLPEWKVDTEYRKQSKKGSTRKIIHPGHRDHHNKTK